VASPPFRSVEASRSLALETEQNAADERHQRGFASLIGTSEQHNALVAGSGPAVALDPAAARYHNAPVVEYPESVKVNFAYAHGL
jgi:hypothetical protein